MADAAAQGLRPVPMPDDESAPFWAATAAGRLELARCSACSQVVHPPTPICPACHSTDPSYTWVPVATRGRLRSWTIVRQPFLPGFADDLPIVLADVELAGLEDVRLIGRLLDGPGASMHLEDPVVLDFEYLHDGTAVPAFRLAGAE